MINLYKVGIRTLIVIALSLTLAENSFSKIGLGSEDKSAPIKSQPPSVCNGNVYLTTQAEVDAFPATYHCTEINGVLSISGNDITNLDSLYQITRINGNPGNLYIVGNPLLENIDGLSSLSYVGFGWVYISDNPSLTNLNGLSSLTLIKGGGPTAGLEIKNNGALADVNGLSSLAQIDGAKRYLTVTGNSQLARCCGLYKILKSESLNCSYGCSFVTVSENGSGCTQSEIVAAGPCPIVYNGNITLSSQTDVDTFPATHGYTEITGRFTISGADITNIDSLYSLTKVGELIILGNDELTNLNGLSHLQEVTANCSSIGCGGTNMGFTISNNALLSDISALSSLTKIGPDLVISSNPKLSNLEGLNNVVTVNGRLWIGDNALLSNLNGLASLASIGFYQLVINNNPSLTSLEGLRLITSIPGSLYINNNASLPNLNGLESLTQLNGGGGAYLTISNNASLANIDALSSLRSIHGGSSPSGGLTISNNPMLANLDGLQSLNGISGLYLGTLEITNNASLHEVDGLSSLDTLSGFNLRVTVKDNPLLSNVNGFSSIGLSTPRPTIIVNNNPALTESCGLYGIVSYANHNPGGYVDVTGNGAGCTKSEILAGGPCTGSTTEISSMIFSAVTDTTMTVSFAAASGNPDGYITLMQAFGSPNPDDAPVDGTVYQPGGTIGSSTIVINVGPETSLDIVYLIPNVDYYFDVYSYKISDGYYDYLTDNPLEGIQRTSSSDSTISPSASARMRSGQVSKSSGYSEHLVGNENVSPFPNPFSENITIPFTTKNQNTFVQIVIYDLMGRRIANVANQNFDPGYHEAKWEGIDNLGSRVSQGLYVYSIKTNETNHEMQGMLVAK